MKSSASIDALLGEFKELRSALGLSLLKVAEQLNAIRNANDITESMVCRWEGFRRPSGCKPDGDRTISLIQWVENARQQRNKHRKKTSK